MVIDVALPDQVLIHHRHPLQHPKILKSTQEGVIEFVSVGVKDRDGFRADVLVDEAVHMDVAKGVGQLSGLSQAFRE